MERYTIGIIVDRSGSVIMEKEMIENSIELIVEALDNNYLQDIKKEIIVTYIGEEDTLLPQQVKKIDNEEKRNIENILESKNIFELFERISSAEGRKKLFFYSDGYFKREVWDRFISKLKEDKKFNEIERISIGIGEGANKSTLKEFSSKGKVFQYKDIFDLV
jgi:hypothetical protein